MFPPFALDINWTVGQDYGQWLSEKLRNNFRAKSREALAASSTRRSCQKLGKIGLLIRQEL